MWIKKRGLLPRVLLHSTEARTLIELRNNIAILKSQVAYYELEEATIDKSGWMISHLRKYSLFPNDSEEKVQ